MFLNSRIDLLNDEIHVQGSLIINSYLHKVKTNL